ncbi:hypothetical protein FIV38_17325 [Pseudomonas proteolytica]|uniref:Uncharacterized protein n=1 Tax=Pseudomonas brenneri TaxID=129817 RepID=A0A5B2UNV2_9PSED|nr:hypothetical protein F1720_21425 [Pseudomonas brenneri]KAA8702297.1 hypothetical protein F4W61_12325 [Pseudomonas proteolytica]QHG25138.1 hypothetical protein GDV60_20715 [Pseudomonas sp. DTU12.1]TWR79862.1 hypothetical protein FIV38_17325 [Pseudomonas proteolytica]TWR79967.1 hypothetical protein FJD34_06690 [Pseudomonas brenneri]
MTSQDFIGEAPRTSVFINNLHHTTDRMWERACSRRRRTSYLIYQLTDRIREQARSHIFRSA